MREGCPCAHTTCPEMASVACAQAPVVPAWCPSPGVSSLGAFRASIQNHRRVASQAQTPCVLYPGRGAAPARPTELFGSRRDSEGAYGRKGNNEPLREVLTSEPLRPSRTSAACARSVAPSCPKRRASSGSSGRAQRNRTRVTRPLSQNHEQSVLAAASLSTAHTHGLLRPTGIHTASSPHLLTCCQIPVGISPEGPSVARARRWFP